MSVSSNFFFQCIKVLNIVTIYLSEDILFYQIFTLKYLSEFVNK